MATDQTSYCNLEALKWARKQRVGSAVGQRVLFEIAMRADPQGVMFVGQEKLADTCECSERTIREWLSKLQTMGLLTRERRRRETGSRSSDALKLALPQPAKSAGSNRQMLPVRTGKSRQSYRQNLPGINNTEEINPLTPLEQESVRMAVRDVLTAFGMTAETAEAVMDAYSAAGQGLQLVDAIALIGELDRSDPEASGRGLAQQLAGDGVAEAPKRSRSRQAVTSATPSVLKGFREGEPVESVKPADDPDLFDACVVAMRQMRGENYRPRGEWKSVTFPAEVVQAARLSTGR